MTKDGMNSHKIAVLNFSLKVRVYQKKKIKQSLDQNMI